MPNRMGNAGAPVLIGALATVVFAVTMNGVAHAADNCLAGPKGAAPKGSHWYYRIDRATKRNCWYVRAEGGKPVAPQNSSIAQAPPVEAPLQPMVANARAEAGPLDIGRSDGGPAEPLRSGADSNAPAADSGQSTVASRWLDQTAANAADTSTPDPADSDVGIDAPTQSVAASPPAAANERPASPSGSVSTLFLVMVGALAVAALFGGVIIRFGSARRNDPEDFTRDRHAPWDSTDVGAAIRSPSVATETPTPTHRPAREHPSAVVPDEIVQLLTRLSKEAAA